MNCKHIRRIPRTSTMSKICRKSYDILGKCDLGKNRTSVTGNLYAVSQIRRKIRRKNATHAKAKKTGSAKFRTKFETLRREIKADIRKQHELYVVCK